MVCIMVGMGTVRAQETQEALSQTHDSLRIRTVYVHDTIYIERPAVEATQPDSSEIIYTKPVGRFDRGIINYRFIPKKKWVGGLTFSYINYDGEDSRMLFSLIKDFDCNFRTISVRPFVGYAFKDNVIVGLKAGYNHTVADLGNISLNIDDDLSFDLKDIRYSEDSYSIALFHRSYVGLDRGKRFGFFNFLQQWQQHFHPWQGRSIETHGNHHTRDTSGIESRCCRIHHGECMRRDVIRRCRLQVQNRKTEEQ